MRTTDDLNSPEVYYPLKVFVCDNCWLVQVDELKKATEIFSDDYTYFSSFSQSWLKHSESYVDYMMDRFNFNSQSLIVEIASNDGYLLQYFSNKDIPVLGIEPTSNTAAIAIDKGIPTIVDFFGTILAEQQLKGKADLIIGNNVLALVPNINDFVSAVSISLKSGGIATFEFPHLYQLVKFNQFDTIYHEHFSYLSLTSVVRIFESAGLVVFDVQEINTHGGSLRIFVKSSFNSNNSDVLPSVERILSIEKDAGILSQEFYMGFETIVEKIRDETLLFLIRLKREGKHVVGYGAAAKGNTLIN
jgi:SAM-dependent methyltransferase